MVSKHDPTPPWAGELLGARRWLRVAIAGPSMAPTLLSGDVVLALRNAQVSADDIVIACFPALVGRFVVKRVVRAEATGWWVESDNSLVTDDSRRYGPALVVARVMWRYWPLLRVRSRS